MDAVMLSRIQFAATIGFHFIFAPLTIGLSWLIFWLLTRYRHTGEMVYRQLAQFWVKIFALSFAVGVASGLTMEFQFGTNWANYSRFVGGVFGVPLAIEVIGTFFLESTFLYVVLVGWDRVSPKAHWFAGLMVAVGSTMSAFWILVANSWMQTPAGYTVHEGRAVLTDFWAAIFNPSTIPRFLHTTNAALMTGAFFMLGVSAWFLLKQRHVVPARITLTLALVVAFTTSVVQLGLGHYHAIQVTQTQPAKLAAYEGVFATHRGVGLLVFGIPDVPQRKIRYEIRIPYLLSLLVGFNPRARITGLAQFPTQEWPPMLLTFFPFHLMVAIGLYLIVYTTLGMWLLWKRSAHLSRKFLLLAVLTIPLPFLANELGWMGAEVGRQPWIVYRQLATQDAISVTVPAVQILFSIILFSLIYGALFLTWLVFIRREMRQGIGEPAASTGDGQ